MSSGESHELTDEDLAHIEAPLADMEQYRVRQYWNRVVRDALAESEEAA